MTLTHANKSKDALKKYGELWKKISDLIRSTSNNIYEKDIKIRFNSDSDLPLKKKIELHNILIVLGFIFNDHNKYYPHIFLDECLYKLA